MTTFYDQADMPAYRMQAFMMMQNSPQGLIKFPVGSPVLFILDKVYQGEVIEVTETFNEYTRQEPCWHLVRCMINPESDSWSEAWFTGDQLQIDIQRMRDQRITEITDK
jgi:hypothetical protein